jgi:deoxyribodipyrimidine photolyase-related protein
VVDDPDGHHQLTGVGLGAPWTAGDPALGVFPERAPATRRWCFADQLGPHFLDDPDQPVLLVESRAVFASRRFHRQKAHLVLSALRHRAAELGEQVSYHRVRTYAEALDRCAEPLSVCAPTTRGSRDLVLRRPGLQVLAARGFVNSQEGRACAGRCRAWSG